MGISRPCYGNRATAPITPLTFASAQDDGGSQYVPRLSPPISCGDSSRRGAGDDRSKCRSGALRSVPRRAWSSMTHLTRAPWSHPRLLLLPVAHVSLVGSLRLHRHSRSPSRIASCSPDRTPLHRWRGAPAGAQPAHLRLRQRRLRARLRSLAACEQAPVTDTRACVPPRRSQSSGRGVGRESVT